MIWRTPWNTGSRPLGPASGDLSGNYPAPDVVADSHTHTSATVTGFVLAPSSPAAEDLMLYRSGAWSRFGAGAAGTLLGYSGGLLVAASAATWGLASAAPAWSLYRHTDLSGATGTSPWTFSDTVGSSTWTTCTGTVTVSGGLVLTPGLNTSNFQGASYTGAAVTVPIAFLPSYQNQRVVWLIKVTHSVTPGTGGVYMSPATAMMASSAASANKYAGGEYGASTTSLKVQPRYHDGSDRQGGVTPVPSTTPTWVGIELAPGGMRYRTLYGSPSGSPGVDWDPSDLTPSDFWYPVVTTATMGPQPTHLGVSASRGTSAYTATITDVVVFTGSGGD